MKSTLFEVMQAVRREQEFQAKDREYGELEERTETEIRWCEIMDDEMGEVVNDVAGYDFTHAREEVLQVVASGANWLMKYGVEERDEVKL